MKKILLSAIIGLSFMACGDESTGPDPIDYSTSEINKERLLDKTATWIMDASVATAATNKTLPEDVMALVDSKQFSTYLSKGSLSIKFQNDGKDYAVVNYTDESGRTDEFYYNEVSFATGSFTLGDINGCDQPFTNSVCDIDAKVITGKMTEDYLVLSGSPFLKNDPKWGGIEIFKRVQ